MKPDQIYQQLIELAEKFEITVSEQNFKATNVKAASGFCIVKGHKRFIIDKQLKIHGKIDVLAAFLSKFPHEDIFMMPALRDILGRYRAD